MEYGEWQGTDWDTIDAAVATHVWATNRIGLWGPPGTGKSHVFIQQDPVTLACNEGMLASDFYGAKMPAADGKGGTGMEWQDGPALIAAREDRPLLLNEIDKASDDVKEVLYEIASDPEVRRLTYTNGGVNTVKTGENFRVFATSNLPPERLPEALRTRFLWLYVDEPAPGALALLPERLREPCRALAGHPDPTVRMSLREFRRYADLLDNIAKDDPEKAAKLAFGERWQEFADADRLANLVERAIRDREMRH